MGNLIAKNDSIELKHEDYINFTKHLVDELFLHDEVISIYQLGGLTQPGISDIDLIVVTKNDLIDRDKIDLSNNSLCKTDKERYMLMHPPFIIPYDLFPHLEMFFYCSDLTLLKGEFINLVETEASLDKIYKLHKILSFLIHTYPRFSFVENNISIRSFLTFGYSLKHTYRLLNADFIQFNNEDVEAFINQIIQLRKDVFLNKVGLEFDITEIVNQGKKSCKIMLNAIHEILADKYPQLNSKDEFFYIKNDSNVLHFSNYNNTFDIVNHSFYNIIKLPTIFGNLILAPLNDGSELSKFQKKQIIGKVNIVNTEDRLFEKLSKTKYLYDLYKKHICEGDFYNAMPFELNTTLYWQESIYKLNYSIKNQIINMLFKLWYRNKMKINLRIKLLNRVVK